MKKLLSILLTASLVVLSASACTPKNDNTSTSTPGAPSQNSQAAPQNRLEKIKAAGKIVMATSPDFAPNEFIDPTKTGQEAIVGADIELAKHIAKELGVELVIESMDFASVITAVTQGKVDMAISGLAYKEDRAQQMGLSSPFNKKGYQGLLIRSDETDNYKELTDFNGKKVGAQSGSLQLANVESQLTDAKIELVATVSEGILMLKTGKIDALAMSGVQGEEYAKNDTGIQMANPRFVHENTGNHVGVPKGETELLEAISKIVEDVEESGQYAVWQDEARALADSLKVK